MPDLFWEVWREDDFEMFCFVCAETDRQIASIFPNATRIMSIHAPSDIEARRIYERLSVDEDWEPPEGMDVHIYSDEDAIEQAGYLNDRSVG